MEAYHSSYGSFEVLEQRLNPKGEEKKATQWQKPLFIALIIIGLMGLGVGATGLAAYGNHHWWVAGGLSEITHLQAVIMMSAGFSGGAILLTIGIVGLVKTKATPQQQNHKYDHLELRNNQWTFFREENGLYSLVANQGGTLTVIVSEIPFDRLELSKNEYIRAHKAPQHVFILTSPTHPTHSLISFNDLNPFLTPGSHTYVLQVNGNYSLFSNDNEGIITIDCNNLSHADVILELARNRDGFITTSPIMSTDPIIDLCTLNKKMTPGTFTFVRQFGGDGYCGVVKLENSMQIGSIPDNDLATVAKVAAEEKGLRFILTSKLPDGIDL